MADAWTSHSSASCPQLHLAWNIKSQNDVQVVFEYHVYYVAHGYAARTNGVARKWTINIDGQTKSGSYNINGITGTKELSKGTITVSKTTAARTVKGTCSFVLDITWSGAYNGTVSGNSSINIGAKTKYTVSYKNNGGTGAPDSQTKWYGTNLTLSSVIPTRSGYTFLGWGSSSAGKVEYKAKAIYSKNASITLYAIWKLNYIAPTLNKVYAIRCDYSGESDVNGTYAKVFGEWSVDTIIDSTNEATKITLEYRLSNESSWTSAEEISISGVSGSIGIVFGNGTIDVGNVYYVRVTVYDKGGKSSTQTTLPASSRPFDIGNKGATVAIGKAASNIPGFEVAYPARFENGLTENIPILDSVSCDDIKTTGKYYIDDTCTSRPYSIDGWLECKMYSTDYCAQIYTTKSGNIYRRYMRNGTWGVWSAGLVNKHKLWSGTLSGGGSITVDCLNLYDIFMARTSDGETTMVGIRYYDDSGNRRTSVRFTGGYNDGSESYTFEANTVANENTFKLIACSKHKLSGSGVTGTVLQLKSLWGVM